MYQNNKKFLFFIFIIILFFRLIIALLLPPVQDEAYYFVWSQYLDWGYFDHPPMVSWLSIPFNICHKNYAVFCARLSSVFLISILFFISIKFFKLCGINSLEALISALIACYFNIAAMVVGVLSTPDAGLTFFYAVALYYGAKAIKGAQYNWVLCGIASGFALLSKYTAIFLAIIFCIVIIKDRFKELKNYYLYIGLLCAILIFSTNIIWNYKNNWITFRFQLKHGLQNSYDVGSFISDLPQPLDIKADSHGYKLFAYFEKSVQQEQYKKFSLSSFNFPYFKIFSRFLNFLLMQLLLWGFLLVPLFIGLCKIKLSSLLDNFKTIDAKLRFFLIVSVLAPLFFFGLISLKSSVEVNWPALYIYPASIIFVAVLKLNFKSLFKYAFLNIIFLLGFLFYSLYLNPLEGISKNRITAESFGYKELSMYVSKIQQPIFADRYQLISMLKLYNPNLKISQYPNLSRASEFIRRKELNFYSLSDLIFHKEFFILTKSIYNIPAFDQFFLSDLQKISVCKNFNTAQIYILASNDYEIPKPQCLSNMYKTWYLAHYVYKD